MIRLARLTRNGNSVALTIHPAFLRELAWHRGDHVAVGIEDGRVVARKVREEELLPAPPPAAAFDAGRKRKR